MTEKNPDRRELERLEEIEDGKQQKRCQAALCIKEGPSLGKTAGKIGMSHISVKTWRDRLPDRIGSEYTMKGRTHVIGTYSFKKDRREIIMTRKPGPEPGNCPKADSIMDAAVEKRKPFRENMGALETGPMADADASGPTVYKALKRGLRRRNVRSHGLLYIKDMELSGMDVSGAAGRWMAAIVLAVAVMAFLVPDTGLWIHTGWINYLLMAVMFGMGLTISPQDFKVVFTRPRDVAVGCVAQFTIMPILAYVLCVVFGLEAGLMAGVILVGACPGGTASNVITLFSKGDVPLSVGMTVVNTLLAPVVTPLLVYLALHESIDFDILQMFLSIVQVVIIPIALGFVISHFFGKQTGKAKDVLPVVSLAAISLIVMCVVSHSVGPLRDCGIAVFAVVVLHNLLGYVCGYAVALLFRMPESRKRALSIEVGMQNSGLATSLAATSFPSLAMATVPGAVFSVWHNISGALLAAWYSGHDVGKKNDRMRSPRTCRRRTTCGGDPRCCGSPCRGIGGRRSPTDR